MSEFKFDYGVVVYKHRFSINRSLDDYESITLNKCLRISVILYDNLGYEMQILYRDENDILQCLCLDLHDWTFNIKYIGDMQCYI